MGDGFYQTKPGLVTAYFTWPENGWI